MLWRRKSKRVPAEKPEPEHAEAAQKTTAEEAPTTQEEPEAQEAAAPASEERAPEAGAPEERAPEAVAAPRETTAQKAPEEPEMPGATTAVAAAPSPIAAPVKLAKEPSEPAGVDEHDTAQRDAAATGNTVADMHVIKPITSPRADSKLKTWFRDRLVRRSSLPVPVYPNQPGPEYTSDSEVGFTGGAALTGRDEPRGAALSSHPVTSADLDAGASGYNGNAGEVAQTTTIKDSAETEQNGDGKGNSKRNRFRMSFMKTVSSGSPEQKTNGVSHSRQNSEAISDSKETATDLQGLRDSAVEQGLPVPPGPREPISTGRESRFSEDL